MPKIIKKLSEAQVRNALPKEKPYKLYDDGGLRLLVRPTGAKVWQYPYTANGKSNTYTIGQYCPKGRAGYVGTADARMIRDEIRELLQQGLDPNRHKLRLRSASEESSQTSFEAIAREWHGKGTWVEKHAKNILKSLEDDVFPLIGKKQIDRVSTQDVIAVISAVEKRQALDVASHVLAFDNISGMSAATSDTLCRMSTGGSLVTRQLFTDQDEVLMNVIRPIILNGIDDVVTRPDLGDRSLVLTLEPIPEARRRPESEINGEYDQARPAILGALLDALSDGLKRLPETKLDSHPRMADFALWATACEVALWGETGTFIAAYEANRADAIDEILEAHPVASSMRQLMEYRPSWSGTAAMLLSTLSENALSAGRLPKTWPDSPRGLSGDLRRIAPFLRKVGIEIIFDKKDKTRNRDRLITISKFPVS